MSRPHIRQNPAYATQPRGLDAEGINAWLLIRYETAVDPQPYLERLRLRGVPTRCDVILDDEHCDWPD